MRPISLKCFSYFSRRASFDVTVVEKQYRLYPQRWWIVFSVGLLLFTKTLHFMSYPSVSKHLAAYYKKVNKLTSKEKLMNSLLLGEASDFQDVRLKVKNTYFFVVLLILP